MNDQAANIFLRPLEAGDGPAIAALGEQSPDTGAIGFHSRFHADPYAVLMALHPHSIGVVAVAPDHPGIVGMGMLSLGECQYEGAVHPLAYLYSLSVHPHYRRRGIASQLAAWRIDTARERNGPDCVILAGIQQGNQGSLLTAGKWSTQRIDGRTQVVVAKMRSQPPKNPPGIEIRLAGPGDWEQAVARQNAFYTAYNLYPPQTAQSLEAHHCQLFLGHPVREYVVAVDRQGQFLAGASVTMEGPLISSQVVRMPQALRLLNKVLKIIPADGTMRRLMVRDVWFAPGRQDAVASLWETLRWRYREQGNLLMIFLDPHSALAEVIRSSRFMPPQGGSYMLHAAGPMSVNLCIYQHI